MSLFCRVMRRSPSLRWFYWCYKFRQIVPWNVRFIGIPKCHPLTPEEIEHAQRVEEWLESRQEPDEKAPRMRSEGRSR